jgi:hypothetical protein
LPDACQRISRRGQGRLARGQVQHHPVEGRDDWDTGPAAVGHQSVDLLVGAPRVVVEEHQPAGPAPFGQPGRVLHRGVAEETQPGHLNRGVLGIVDKQVSPGSQGDGCLVVDADALRAGSQRQRAVVGQESQDRCAVADPVPEGPPALVRDLQGQHRESLEFVVSRLERAERPAAPEFLGPDREVRRCDGLGQHLFRVGVLSRQVDIDPVAFLHAPPEERHAVGVVPVQVTEQHGTLEGSAAQRRRQLLQAGSGIEHQGWRFIAVC